ASRANPARRARPGPPDRTYTTLFRSPKARPEPKVKLEPRAPRATAAKPERRELRANAAKLVLRASRAKKAKPELPAPKAKKAPPAEQHTSELKARAPKLGRLPPEEKR